jgi:hypothetical protein
MVAERAAVAVNTRVLCNPAIGHDKPVAKIKVWPVPAFAHRGRSDLLLEVRRRDQTPSPQNRPPLAKVVKVGGGQPRRRTPEGVPVGAILIKFAIHREGVQDRALDFLIGRELCVFHAERSKDIRVVQLLHRLAGGSLNHLTQNNVVRVGVLLARARREVHLAVAHRVVDLTESSLSYENP